jgi:hypothetical protein
MNTTTITTEQIDQLINICNDTKISSDDIGVELNELYNLTTQKDIENCLLEQLFLPNLSISSLPTFSNLKTILQYLKNRNNLFETFKKSLYMVPIC